jgi:glutamate-1-semialdehyde aminotransferase
LTCFGQDHRRRLAGGRVWRAGGHHGFLAPLGPVYQAGTLSGNPLAMAAGIAALEELSRWKAYAKLWKNSARPGKGLKEAAKSAGIPFNSTASARCSADTSPEEPVHNLADAMKSDRARFAKYFHGMLAEGIYLAPSQFEAGFHFHGPHDGGHWDGLAPSLFIFNADYD